MHRAALAAVRKRGGGGTRGELKGRISTYDAGCIVTSVGVVQNVLGVLDDSREIGGNRIFVVIAKVDGRIVGAGQTAAVAATILPVLCFSR